MTVAMLAVIGVYVDDLSVTVAEVGLLGWKTIRGSMVPRRHRVAQDGLLMGSPAFTLLQQHREKRRN
jgi:hypothetical protein